MAHLWPKNCAVAVGLLALYASCTYADDFTTASFDNTASFERRIAELEANYESLRSSVSRLPATTSTSACRTCCCPPTGGFLGGAAIVFAQPWVSGNSPFQETQVVNGVLVDRSASLRYDFDDSLRFWLGYQTPGGHGIRTRYWTFDGDADLTSFTDPANGGPEMILARVGLVGSQQFSSLTSAANTAFIARQDLDLDVFDFEYTRAINRSWANVIFSGGLRYAAYDQDLLIRTQISNTTIRSEFDLHGIGPTLGIQLTTPAAAPIQLYGSGRAGVLFSQFDHDIRTGVGPVLISLASAADRNHAVGSFEGELGLRLARPLGGGTTFFAQGAIQGQLWTETAHSNHDLISLGFFGLSASIGIAR